MHPTVKPLNQRSELNLSLTEKASNLLNPLNLLNLNLSNVSNLSNHSSKTKMLINGTFFQLPPWGIEGATSSP
jgi:hypothetical protein